MAEADDEIAALKARLAQLERGATSPEGVYGATAADVQAVAAGAAVKGGFFGCFGWLLGALAICGGLLAIGIVGSATQRPADSSRARPLTVAELPAASTDAGKRQAAACAPVIKRLARRHPDWGVVRPSEAQPELLGADPIRLACRATTDLGDLWTSVAFLCADDVPRCREVVAATIDGELVEP